MLDEMIAGLYLAVDAEGRLRWLGKAHRDGGVGARLRGHLAHPAAEGRTADLLGLRSRMGIRRWPVVTESQ